MGIRDLFKKKTPPKREKIAFAYIGSGGNTVIWSEDSYENFAKDAYMENVISFQCINQIAESIAMVPWKPGIEDSKGKFIASTDWNIKRPFIRANIFQSFSTFLYSAICYYYLHGNSYVWRNTPKITMGAKAFPTEFWSYRPDKFSVETNEKGFPVKYKYEDGSFKQEWDIDLNTGYCDILHLKTFHPLNSIFGMPTAKPASKEIDISNESSKWNMRLMMNEARPGMIVMLKGFLTEDQFERVQKQLQLDHTGAVNAGKSLILESEEGIVDVKPYSWSPKDLDFLEGGREQARRICIGYKVPPMILGIPGDNTYSNYQEARSALWEDTCFPKLQYFINEFSCWLFGIGPDIGYGESAKEQLVIKPDMDNIPALAYKQNLMWDRAEKGKDFLTLNERREIVGMEPTEGGDVLFVSASMLPLDQAVLPPEPVPAPLAPGKVPVETPPKKPKSADELEYEMSTDL
jgi:HK97 family phage portal protein